MMTRKPPRSGLVLLIVLGMLALLSLVTVTYLVFSAESRRASMQLARGDYRGTAPDKLFDQIVHQVIRGTKDKQSPLWLNDLLGDLYGQSTDEPFQVHEARPTTGAPRDNPARLAATPYSMPTGLTTYNAASPEAPRLYGGHLLKIPIAWPVGSPALNVKLPEQHDAWTGRVLTFMQGPLEGQSFRIVRYMGEVEVVGGVLETTHAANQYSVLIDLNEVRDRVTSRLYGGTMVTRSVNDWITQTAPRHCIELLYANIGGNAPNYTLDDPYNFFISAGVTNSNGAGVDLAGNLQFAQLSGSTVYTTIPTSLLGNHGRAHANQPGYVPTGDTDESYDAVDPQNFFLAMRQADPATPIPFSDASDRITPSYHRQAVINFLMKPGIIPDFASFNPSDNNVAPAQLKQLIDYIELIRRATARPLSVHITDSASGTVLLSINPSFTGSNLIDNRAGFGLRTPQLSFDWQQINNPATIDLIRAWLRWLTRGPWDVDNDGDLINDSNWVDVNFPLVTSPEGKLLKVLAAFYIEDMEGKLDLNAAGSREQADDTAFNQGRVNNVQNHKYAYLRNYTAPGSGNTHWPQGTGYGTADISLRPLFEVPGAGPSQSYGNFLNYRYSSSFPGVVQDTLPGMPTIDDPISMLNERSYTAAGMSTYRGNNQSGFGSNGYAAHCFPFSTRGRAGIALDLLGNPIMFETDGTFNETIDDPYDPFVLRDRHGDHGVSVSDWERLTRFNDVDRSGLPYTLQKLSPLTMAPRTTGYLSRIRSISPRNVSLNLPRFAGEYIYNRYVMTSGTPVATPMTRRVSSFIEFVEAYAQARFGVSPGPFFTTAQLRQLFPIEFRQNMPLDINRPLGNGSDDNGNAVIDEADEIATGQLARYPNNAVSTVAEEYARLGATFDPDLELELPAIQSRFDGNKPKQYLARHLYCLAQLILPESFVFANDSSPAPSTPTAPTPDEIRRRARILAQWAVNVVDFRDADSAMTRFAYDENPFDGAGWVPADGVVFGVEAPELLLTESLALHDMRIRRNSNTPPGREQLRIPEGSLFLEFMCPRTTMSAATRGSHDGTIPPAMAGLYAYDSAAPTGTLKLNLGAMTPVNASNPVAFPVWRVLLTKPVANAGGFKDRLSEIYETPANRLNHSYQFDDTPLPPLPPPNTPPSPGPQPSRTTKARWFMNPGTSPIPEPEIDRILWFSGAAPTTANAAWSDPDAADKIFYGYAGSNYLAGGQYLVVGPREITYFGSRNQGPGPRDNQPSRQRLQITNSTTSDWVQFWDMNNDPLFWKTPTPPLVAGNTATSAANWPVSSLVRNTVTLIAGMRAPSTWTDPTHDGSDPMFPSPYMIGLNISEPTREDYYPEPLQFLNATNSTRDPDTNAPGFANLPKDAYIDTNASTGTIRPPLDYDGSTHAYLQNAGWRAGAEPDRPGIRTEANWSAAVLQRLADPLRGHDEKYNPYITVDWLPIDLTVFSGEEQFTPDDPIRLGTRRKTGAMIHPTMPVSSTSPTPAQLATLAGSTFYSYHSAGVTTDSVATGHSSQPYFDFELPMEYICKSPAPAVPPRDSTATFATLGYLNPQFTIRGTVGGSPTTDDYAYIADNRFLGAPGPNLAAGLNVPLAPYHPNRDFVNVLELTSVPLSSPSGLMQDFGHETTPSDALPLFTHTLDFEDLRTPAPAPVPPATVIPLSRKLTTGMLLELLTTKSPWPDASKVENPAVMMPSSGTLIEVNAQQTLLEPYRAPLNFVPTFREPGKINLNTLTEDTVFRGLIWNAMTPSLAQSANWATSLNEKMTSTTMPYWTEFQNMRRGFALSSNPLSIPTIPNLNPYLNANYPAEFAQPFTTATAYEKYPQAGLTAPAKYDRASHSGLLRRGEATTATPTMGLFELATTSAPKPRLFRPDVNNIYPEGATPSKLPFNTYIRNYPASRLANLTTDRSHVFAIRVTLGFFEADTTGNIGIEYGTDRGTAKRHRAVYVVDRSIPVGYQPGEDINTDNIILLRRIIE